jgi:HAD superfamily hydrolase (TIGR01509 family)
VEGAIPTDSSSELGDPVSRLGERIKGVIFDMDGTIVSSELDFDRIRAEARVPAGVPILEFIAGGASEDVLRVLLEHEDRAARQCSLQPGALQVLSSLRGQGVKLALFTRNSRDSVRLVLERLGLEFDCWVAREDAQPKPSPEPVLKIAATLGLLPEQLLVVGDYVFDIESGRAAGAVTALLKTNKHAVPTPPPDLVLEELADLLHWFPATGAERPGRTGCRQVAGARPKRSPAPSRHTEKEAE